MARFPKTMLFKDHILSGLDVYSVVIGRSRTTSIGSLMTEFDSNPSTRVSVMSSLSQIRG
jgi:hypothetical protein